MANRGSPGCRIEIQDNSAYDIIDNPSLIGGIVGFSPKGELNKILKITNTSVQDKTLGLGYNQPKYNMGLYATRAILNNGGYVHFVRPYGEQVVKTDKFKSDLKSDAFVVAYDRGAAKSDYAEICDENRKLGHTSLDVRHFAATRYIEDGFAGFGGKRKINTIQETIAENSNVDFYLTAGTEFNEEGKPNDVRSDTNMVLFSIVNSDPTSAQRASDRYNVTNITGGGTKFILTCESVPSFIVGDVIFIPSIYLDATHKASGNGVYATVTKILDTDVTVELNETVTGGIAVGKNGFAFYCNNDDTTTGVDYLTVKTAVANRAVKKYGKFDYVNDEFAPGAFLNVYDANHAENVARFAGSFVPTNTGLTFDTTNKTVTFTMGSTDKANLMIGDELVVSYSATADTTVTTGKFTAEIVSYDATTGSVVSSYSGIEPDSNTTYTASKIYVSPAEDSCDAVIDIVELSVPTERSSILSDVIASTAVDTMTLGTEKNTIVLTKSGQETTHEAAVEAATAQAKVFTTTLEALLQNEELLIKLGTSTDAVSGLFANFDEATITYDETDDTKWTVTSSMYLYDALETEETTVSSMQKRCWTSDFAKVSDGDIILSGSDRYYVESVGTAGELTLSKNGEVVTEGTLDSVVIDMTATTSNTLAALNSMGFQIESYIGEDATIELTGTNSTQLAIQLPAGTSTQYTVGDLVTFVDQKRSGAAETGIFTINDVFTISSINSYKDIVIVDYDDTVDNKKAKFGTNSVWKLVDLTASKSNIWVGGYDGLTFYMIGAYGLKIAAASQLDKFIVDSGDCSASTWFTFVYTTYEDGVVERTDKVLISDEVGATFAGLGLASVKYEDDTFSGNSKQMYALTTEGEAIARMYVYINYYFNGTSYEMEGTLAPYQHDGTQLYIVDTANYVLEGTGAKLILNDSGILDNFLENNAYDLSQTVRDGQLDSVTTKLAFDEHDPAILNDAIWSYYPSNNNDSATLSNAWNLFLDKDATDVNMLVAAGTDITNLFMKKRELLNTTVISAILNICELRKDCFAIIDGVGEANIDTTLKKMIGVESFGTKGRWGACYDGRGVFYDSYYTMMNVEVVKTVQLAAIITANAKNGIWWFPPAGETQAVIPAEWGSSELYPRTFMRPEDTESDIAKLLAIHVNPTRSNDEGMFIWGDYTMQKATTAFDQIHVAMLIAGIHKRFYHYLDKKTFKINSTVLRADITSDLQAQLDIIIGSNPPGLYSGVVVCNDSNNPAEVIDRNELIVELKLKPTKTARYITLRTVVESNGSSNEQTTSISV